MRLLHYKIITTTTLKYLRFYCCSCFYWIFQKGAAHKAWSKDYV